MPIYDQPILQSQLRPLPQVSLNPHYKYGKDSCFQTPFTGKLTDKAIERYALLGRYGSKEQSTARERLGAKESEKNVKRAIANILANKYITI